MGDGDCSKPLLNPERTVDNVGPPEFWSNRPTLEKEAKGEDFM